MTSQLEEHQLLLLHDCLRKQLEEFEMLSSIYSMPGEFQSDNPSLVQQIENFLNGKRSMVSEKLDFRIKVQVTEEIKMELSVMLGQLYPSHEIPIFTIRTDSLNKTQENLVKRAMENFIETEVDKSDPYIYQIISWLQDNIEEIIAEAPSKSQKDEKTEEKNSTSFERVWIWSHHIYSKIKRQNIMKLTRNNDLSGFMWPGKPGVICLEGPTDNVQDVVRAIRSWQWQKLKVVQVEQFRDAKLSRFEPFEEILTSDGDDGEEVKMNTSQFFKYLDAHESSHMRKEIFGFE